MGQRFHRCKGRHRVSSTASLSGRRRLPGHRLGLSLIEMLIALAIISALMAATVLAIDASFYAYASAASSASTQTSTRLTVHRLTQLIRESRAHDPVSATAHQAWPDTMLDTLQTRLQETRGVDRPAVQPRFPKGAAGNRVRSDYLYVIDPQGNHRLFTYVRLKRFDNDQAAAGELWLTTKPAGSSVARSQPLLRGVIKRKRDGTWPGVFTLHRRLDSEGIWVLERGSAELTVRPSANSMLAIEQTGSYKQRSPIEVVVSTAPRRLN